MLRSVDGRTISLLADGGGDPCGRPICALRLPATERSQGSPLHHPYSSWPRKFRLVPFVVIAILLFPLIASLRGQAALAQISPGQTYPAQT
jgi:hypothetical protein